MAKCDRGDIKCPKLRYVIRRWSLRRGQYMPVSSNLEKNLCGTYQFSSIIDQNCLWDVPVPQLYTSNPSIPIKGGDTAVCFIFLHFSKNVLAPLQNDAEYC